MAVTEARKPRSRDRRYARTERAIREALFRLVEQEDYRKVTVAGLAREADIDRKTFYLHYESVDDLVDAIVHDEAEHIARALREESFLEGGSVNVASLFFNLSTNLAPDLAGKRAIMSHLSVDTLLDKIEKHLTEALIDENRLQLVVAEPYVGFCVSFFVSGLVAVYCRWLLTDSEVPLEELADITNTAVLQGIGGLAGAASPRVGPGAA